MNNSTLGIKCLCFHRSKLLQQQSVLGQTFNIHWFDCSAHGNGIPQVVVYNYFNNEPAGRAKNDPSSSNEFAKTASADFTA